MRCRSGRSPRLRWSFAADFGAPTLVAEVRIMGPLTELEVTANRARRVGCLGSIALFAVCAIWQILDGPVFWALLVLVVVTTAAEVAILVANIPARRERQRAAKREPRS